MSAVSHIGFMGGEAGADEESANGSLDRATVLAEDGMGDCGHSLSGQIRNAYPCGKQTSVAPGGGSMPAFTESEGDNGDAIAQEGVAALLDRDQVPAIAECAESDDAASTQSTGKMDPQAPGSTKSVE